MRIWSLHPKYLDAKGLVALWRETLLAKYVLEGKTKGYTQHPQLQRFKMQTHPLGCILQYLTAVCEEAENRGYRFDKEKIKGDFEPTQIPVTSSQLAFERLCLLQKLATRDLPKYTTFAHHPFLEPHPMFQMVQGAVEAWEIRDVSQHLQDRAGRVKALSKSPVHSMQKQNTPTFRLLADFGVEGDAHAGATVRHRSRVAQDPTQPNLRQVHLIHSELHAELAAAGFSIVPGQMGENITTEGLELLKLPRHTQLHIGESAIIEVTGLRNPCLQLDGLQKGLMQAVLGRDSDGHLIRKAGIMGMVLVGGLVQTGDEIWVQRPSPPFLPLERV